MDQRLLKEKVAEAAFERVAAEHSDKLLLGIAPGSKANEVIPEVISEIHLAFKVAVISSSFVETLLIREVHEGVVARKETAHQQAIQKKKKAREILRAASH